MQLNAEQVSVIRANDKQTKLDEVEKVEQLPNFNGRIGKQFQTNLTKGEGQKNLIKVVAFYRELLNFFKRNINGKLESSCELFH